jgi:hypothetical protein
MPDTGTTAGPGMDGRAAWMSRCAHPWMVAGGLGS